MITIPYPNEHACQILSPAKFKEFRRVSGAQKHDGKDIDVIYGITGTGAERKSEIQTLRYPKDIWTEASAEAHCKSREGAFEPAKAEEKEQLNIPPYPWSSPLPRVGIVTYPSPQAYSGLSPKKEIKEKEEDKKTEVREVNIQESASHFNEAKFDDEKRNVTLTFIEAGWSKNGNYWDKEVLEKELVPLLKERKKMYIDHLKKKDEGPRSLNDWAGVLENPVFENGKVRGTAHITSPYSWLYDEAKIYPEEIGTSVDVRAIVEEGEREGKKGRIIKKLTGFNSSDFVSQASAGGRIEAIQEEEMDKNKIENKGGENVMEFKDLTVDSVLLNRPDILNPFYKAIEKLESTNKDLEKKVAEAEMKVVSSEKRATEAEKKNEELEKKVAEQEKKTEGLEGKVKEMEQKAKEAEQEKEKEKNKKKIKEELDKAGLPDIAKGKVEQKLNEKNYKDEKELSEAIGQAVETERDYLKKITGKEFPVKGMGEGSKEEKEKASKGAKHLEGLSDRMDAQLGVTVQEEKKEKEKE